MNYLAIVIAAVAAWLFGAGWYMALGKPWMAALGTTPDQMAKPRSDRGRGCRSSTPSSPSC